MNEEKIKELCYIAFLANTTEDEFRWIICKEPRVEFEKWWILNKNSLND